MNPVHIIHVHGLLLYAIYYSFLLKKIGEHDLCEPKLCEHEKGEHKFDSQILLVNLYSLDSKNSCLAFYHYIRYF